LNIAKFDFGLLPLEQNHKMEEKKKKKRKKKMSRPQIVAFIDKIRQVVISRWMDFSPPRN